MSASWRSTRCLACSTRQLPGSCQWMPVGLRARSSWSTPSAPQAGPSRGRLWAHVGWRPSAVAAVLGSQFAALGSVVTYVLFRERLTRLLVAGVVATFLGVAVLMAVTAA